MCQYTASTVLLSQAWHRLTTAFPHELYSYKTNKLSESKPWWVMGCFFFFVFFFLAILQLALIFTVNSVESDLKQQQQHIWAVLIWLMINQVIWLAVIYASSLDHTKAKWIGLLNTAMPRFLPSTWWGLSLRTSFLFTSRRGSSLPCLVSSTSLVVTGHLVGELASSSWMTWLLYWQQKAAMLTRLSNDYLIYLS